MTSADDLRRAVADARHNPTAEQSFTRSQTARAHLGSATGQCAECGSYRADGKPPTLHHDGCSHADDWKGDPLSYTVSFRVSATLPA